MMKFKYSGDPAIAAAILESAALREAQTIIEKQAQHIARLEVENKRLRTRAWQHNQESINNIRAAQTDFKSRHPFLSRFVEPIDTAEVQQ